MLIEIFFLWVHYFRFLEATTPMTTLPPTTPPPLNSFYVKYAASQHRQDKKLDVKPLAIVKGKTLTSLSKRDISKFTFTMNFFLNVYSEIFSTFYSKPKPM